MDIRRLKMIVFSLGLQMAGRNFVVCPRIRSLQVLTYTNGCVDQFHPQGPGRLRVSKCKAKFDLYIPMKWDRFPFLVLVTRGYHAHHPPPPPTKLPKEMADEVIETIRGFGQDCLDLTARESHVTC